MKPVLLLIPGMLNDARVWDPVARALQGQADIRMADVARQDSIAQMREDAWRQVADLAAGRPLVVAGFSMGGYVALDMLAHAPRAVQGVLLMATSAQPESEQGRAVREKTLAAMAADYPRFVEGVLAFSTHSADDALKAALRQMMLEQGPEVGRRQVLAIMGRQDHRALLATLDMPVRIVCGRQDRVTPPALSEALAQTLTGAQLDFVDEAGHMLPCERPQAVAQVLRDLLMKTSEGDKA